MMKMARLLAIMTVIREAFARNHALILNVSQSAITDLSMTMLYTLSLTSSASCHICNGATQ